MPDLIRLGDRFRTTRPVEVFVTYIQYAPAHTVGGKAELPAGTVVVALDQAPGATAFRAYPEAYGELEPILVPEEERSTPGYASAYGLTLMIDDVGDALEPMDPLNPRPSANDLPELP